MDDSIPQLFQETDISTLATHAKQDEQTAILTDIETNINGISTEAKQDTMITELQEINEAASSDVPTTSDVCTEVTLTLANTAYLLPASELVGRTNLMIYNKSDYDVFVGGSNVTADNGMLVEPGDKFFQTSGANFYAVSAEAGVKINIVESK